MHKHVVNISAIVYNLNYICICSESVLIDREILYIVHYKVMQAFHTYNSRIQMSSSDPLAGGGAHSLAHLTFQCIPKLGQAEAARANEVIHCRDVCLNVYLYIYLHTEFM